MNLIDKYLTAGTLIRELPYVIVFKTTNYCWFNCPHCCENSGPNQPKEFISPDVINYYLNSACQDPKFSGEVVFTGGEIMSAYKFGPTDYVPCLLDKCLAANLNVDIKTNAGWANTNWGKQIFTDLDRVISENPHNKMQISLSLDNFHKNCMENNLQVLKTLAQQNNKVYVHISSFDECQDMFDEMLKRLAQMKIKVQDAVIVHGADIEQIKVLNDCVILRFSTGELFHGGRAKDIVNAKHIQFPQFSFLTAGGFVLMAFDSFGRVTLGENSGKKISTKWHLRDNRIYDLKSIRRALVNQARFQEIQAIIFNKWKPIKIHK